VTQFQARELISQLNALGWIGVSITVNLSLIAIALLFRKMR
jgi:hypothetical protein